MGEEQRDGAGVEGVSGNVSCLLGVFAAQAMRQAGQALCCLSGWLAGWLRLVVDRRSA